MAGTARKTDPELWERVKAAVTDGDKGGNPGQWSALKAQLAVAEYKKAGGTYAGPKQADNHLGQWTREAWGTKSGKPSGKTGERYLPAKAREGLTAQEYRRTTAKKRRDSAAGQHCSRQPQDVAAKSAKARRSTSGQPPGQDTQRPNMNDTPSEMPEAWQEFRSLVNMPAKALRDWLETEHSRGVGWTNDGDDEAVGHRSGRRIVDLLEQGEAPSEAADVAFLRKVVGYVRRHLAQRPDGDVSETRWRYSLMNWGHDPLRVAGKPKRRASAPSAAARPASGVAKRAAPTRQPASATPAARAGRTAVRGAKRATDAAAKRPATTAAKRSATTGRAVAKPPAGTAAKRSAGAGAKRTPAMASQRTTAVKRTAAGPAKRNAGAGAKRPTGATSKGPVAKPPKRVAGAAAKRAGPAASKRPASAAAKRGSLAAPARGAAGRTGAAAKGGRSGATGRRPD